MQAAAIKKDAPDYTSIGKMLKEAREAMQLPAEQVCSDLKIGRAHLKAIEQGEVSNLPGDVYLRGYVKMLANYLRVDVNQLETFTKDLPNPQHKHRAPKGHPNAKAGFMLFVAIVALAMVIYLAIDNKKHAVQEVAAVREMPGYLKAYLTPDYVRNSVAPCLSYPQQVINLACMPEEEQRLHNPPPVATILDLAEVRPSWYLGR